MTVNVRVTRKRGTKCGGAVTATSRITGRRNTTSHRNGLRLKSVRRGGTRVCVITALLTLRKAPATAEIVRVAFRGADLRLRVRIATAAR